MTPADLPRKSLLFISSLLLGMSVTRANTILFYDSDGANNLSRIASQTDAAFVTSSDATTSLGTAASYHSTHASQSHTVTLGSQNDLQFNFGTGIVNGTARESFDNGIWLGTSFVAAQHLALDEISFNLYNNSNSGSSYSARDVAAFVSIGTSGIFTQFGTTHDTTTGNGNQGTITFTDSFSAFLGQTVHIRLAFTARTRPNQDGQGATRVGSLNISAIPGTGPTLTVDTTLPASGPVSHPDNTSYTTTFGAFSANPYFARGQTFTTADTGDANTQWNVTEIALRSKALRNFGPGDNIRLWVFEWLPSANANDDSNWTTNAGLVESDGLSDGDPLDGTTMGAVLVDGLDYSLPASIADGDYLHFGIPNALTLNENSAYGTFFEFIDADGATGDTDVRLGIGNASYPGGSMLRTTDTTNTSFTQDLTLFVSGTPIPGPPSSDLSLASPFQEGMILQRDKPINIWGNALPSTPVSVTIDGNNVTGNSNSTGAWKLELPSLTAGGPHTLTVTSGLETITLTDVLIGDVWFAFGQSNMVRPLSEMDNASFYTSAITGGDLPIRCLKITQRAATSPQDSGSMTWLNNSNPGSWTSVGAVFAYRMHQATGVPTAIIWAAWGSTSIEGWMPLEMTAQFPHFDAIMDDYYANDQANVIAQLNGTQIYNDVYIRTRPNIVYNQMVHPLLPFGISGFLWYQGESNAGTIENCAQYGFTLPAFVTEYRQRFAQGDLPFLGVQLPSVTRTLWPWFREAQDQLTTIPNAHIAVTLDTGSTAGNVHPLDKEPIGIRLSLLARKYQQNEAIEAHGPRFSSLALSGNQATITFTNATGLTVSGASGTPATFELAGTDQFFHPATSATIGGNTVTISSSSEPNPVAVRYAWSPAPKDQLNLVNSDNLPAAPFRTDSFPLPGLGAQAPQSINDAFDTPRDQTLNVPAPGILANDIDLNRDPLNPTLLTDVSFGTLALLPDGSFTYSPDHGYAGPDSFTYRINDGALNSAEATVTLNVTGQSTRYYLWKSAITWGANDDSLTADPDGDGTINFLEFAFDLDPLVPSAAGLPTYTQNGADTSYQFNNAQPGLTYEILLSPDLETWSDPPFATLTSADPTPVTIPANQAANGNLFIRLRVSE
ncbi:MAG: Ig-like domain-containing protein [Verrucomicrobiaceae bacterium]